MIISLSIGYGQGIYPPAAGVSGTTAIHKDSSLIVSWVYACEISRGYLRIDSTHLGKTNSGDSTNSFGKANGTTVSLGDSGVALIFLNQFIHNGIGADFAVFENGFGSGFLELAFVEVSSDGIHFFRFPAFSNTQDTAQIGTFGSLDPTEIHNLAGKYEVNYGTPFDLDEIPNDSLLDKSNITHIKITDVIGNIAPEFAQYDSQGNKINDPWPTPFATGGFDLDAIGLIHVNGISFLPENEVEISIYPNPIFDVFNIEIDKKIKQIELLSLEGKIVKKTTNSRVNVSELPSGVYFVRIITNSETYVRKVVKK